MIRLIQNEQRVSRQLGRPQRETHKQAEAGLANGYWERFEARIWAKDDRLMAKAQACLMAGGDTKARSALNEMTRTGWRKFDRWYRPRSAVTGSSFDDWYRAKPTETFDEWYFARRATAGHAFGIWYEGQSKKTDSTFDEWYKRWYVVLDIAGNEDGEINVRNMAKLIYTSNKQES